MYRRPDNPPFPKRQSPLLRPKILNLLPILFIYLINPTQPSSNLLNPLIFKSNCFFGFPNPKPYNQKSPQNIRDMTTSTHTFTSLHDIILLAYNNLMSLLATLNKEELEHQWKQGANFRKLNGIDHCCRGHELCANYYPP